MSIISGPRILALASFPSRDREGKPASLPFLELTPFIPSHCGPNSVDVRLDSQLKVYDLNGGNNVLDMRKPTPTINLAIPDDGFILNPGILYLGSTVECVECHGLVPWIDGRSSVGRLSLAIHKTAGRGDDGWKGQLTLEISVLHPVRVYHGERIGQLTFFTLEGERQPYSGRYLNSVGPVASRMHLPSSPHGEQQ